MESIHISENIQSIILQGICESFNDKIEYHNNRINQIEKQIKLLQSRIDQAYLDKLDKKISEDFWRLHTEEWIEEKETLTRSLLSFQKSDSSYLENANLILELSRKAAGLFKTQNAERKRQLISMLVSNCSYRDEKLDVQLKKPFDMIMEMSKAGNWCALSDYFRTFNRCKFGMEVSEIESFSMLLMN